MHPAAAQRAADRSHEFLARKRLGDDLIAARGETSAALIACPVGARRDDGDIDFGRPYHASDLTAVHAGKLDVENDAVERLDLAAIDDRSQRFEAVADLLDLVSGAAQVCGEEPTIVGVIVDDENASAVADHLLIRPG
jgi:hypothetical protein